LSIEKKVRDFYLSRWEAPSRQARFDVDRLQIEIYKWDKEASREGVTIYATIGASAYPLRGYGEGHRLEIILGLDPSHDEIASALAALGLYAVRENAVIGHGHTVPAGKPLWPGTRMQTFLLLNPRLSFVAPIEVDENVHVHFLQAVPIFETERMIVAELGVDELLNRWERDVVEFWKGDRHENGSK
jgi:hypothetical protein